VIVAISALEGPEDNVLFVRDILDTTNSEIPVQKQGFLFK
jgi:hypothetical protein